jgi:hypothetical protein
MSANQSRKPRTRQSSNTTFICPDIRWLTPQGLRKLDATQWLAEARQRVSTGRWIAKEQGSLRRLSGDGMAERNDGE